MNAFRLSEQCARRWTFEEFAYISRLGRHRFSAHSYSLNVTELITRLFTVSFQSTCKYKLFWLLWGHHITALLSIHLLLLAIIEFERITFGFARAPKIRTYHISHTGLCSVYCVLCILHWCPVSTVHAPHTGILLHMIYGQGKLSTIKWNLDPMWRPTHARKCKCKSLIGHAESIVAFRSLKLNY